MKGLAKNEEAALQARALLALVGIVLFHDTPAPHPPLLLNCWVQKGTEASERSAAAEDRC